MAERRVRVGSKVGLHARPAAMFVQAAAKQKVRVTIAKDGKAPVDARSILSVLGLDVRGGEEVVLAGDGPGADQALEQLAEVVASDLDAPSDRGAANAVAPQGRAGPDNNPAGA